jgi:hypothetical protein
MSLSSSSSTTSSSSEDEQMDTSERTTGVQQSSSSNAASMAKEPVKPTFVPTNVAVRIFSFVERDDLDNCKLVCKQWKWLVEYGEKSGLPKRPIDALWLTTNSEFTFTVYYGNRVQKFAFKKYFKDRDIKGAEAHKSYLMSKPYSTMRPSFNCGMLVPDTRPVPIDKDFDNFSIFHQKQCKQTTRPLIYNTNRGCVYASKLFTPPLPFFEKMQWVLRDCDVKSLVFCKFSFTDLFVEKFAEYMGAPMQVNQLILHCCKLRSIHTANLQQFLGETIHASDYFLDNLRYVLPNHINEDLLYKTAIRSAKIFYVGRSVSRYNTELTAFNVDDEIFANFVNSLVSEVDLRNKKQVLVQRKFFAIAQSRMTHEAIKDYKRLYARCFPKQKTVLYDHLLFGNNRFVSEELQDHATNGELIDPGDNADQLLPPAQPLPQPPPTSQQGGGLTMYF